ncbi:MAG: hypothetical protein K2X56_26925 [Mycobacterium pseudokansasii]|uniref:IS3 family transposase n=1 Tax=Mycobacterium pseudokansasii TaxID=2341080 RepID=UPI0023F1FB73|nr:IS3 family transposase [Mycobacterium pseudokansasii]MBY0391615.1 hypothetical protein [Mycobacterium pseudokansasii]
MADDRQKAKRDNRFHVGAIDSQLGGGRLRRFVAGQEQDECRRILWIFWSSDGVYGAPRILADLRADGEQVTRKTLAALLCTGHKA